MKSVFGGRIYIVFQCSDADRQKRISDSQSSPQKKHRIKKKKTFWGGIFAKILPRKNLILFVETFKGEKYDFTIEKVIARASWVELYMTKYIHLSQRLYGN